MNLVVRYANNEYYVQTLKKLEHGLVEVTFMRPTSQRVMLERHTVRYDELYHKTLVSRKRKFI